MDAAPPPRHFTVTSGEWELGSWEMHRADPAPALRPWLAAPYLGWRESTLRPLPRREVATLRVPIILNLGTRYEVAMGPERGALESFVAGTSHIPAVVTAATTSAAIQVDLTPLGAFALLGCLMDELSNRVTPVSDVLGADGSLLCERLRDAADWGMCFDLVDAFLLKRLARAPIADPRVAHALGRLTSLGSLVRVDELAREVGWSRKHLSARFRAEVGMSPKLAQRVARFEHLIGHATRPRRRRWTDLAHRCGYFDQAHLNRDFAEFTGTTPGAWLRERLPGDAGVLALDEVAAGRW